MNLHSTTAKTTMMALVILNAVAFSAHAQGMEQSDKSNSFDANKKGILIANGVNVKAEPMKLHHAINSPYEDLKPRLANDGKRLYFSRTFHPGNVNGVNDPEDIWYSDFDVTTNEWSAPKHMADGLNNAGPNYINNVSTTGDTVILGNQYLKKGKMRAGLSYSVNVKGRWSAPVNIDIKNDYNISDHAGSFVCVKTGVIIRSVERDESIGGRDLFVSFWDGGRATEPVNMGHAINTEFEESSPYLAPDNKTLYFASEGHDGFGGFDVYVTHRLDDTWTNWSTPENLGPAVNGALDDEFFSVSSCGKYAVFSKQMSVHDHDLYRISMEELFGEVISTTPTPAVKSTTTSFASL
jgi:hypothetical protein